MPRATVDASVERFDLKSAPPDGFVELRRMSYDQYLQRVDMAGKMTVGGKAKELLGELQMANKKTTLYEFGLCVVNHNLTDENDQPIDFNKPLSFTKLDPRIGQEIAELIDNLHEFAQDETLPNG